MIAFDFNVVVGEVRAVRTSGRGFLLEPRVQKPSLLFGFLAVLEEVGKRFVEVFEAVLQCEFVHVLQPLEIAF